MRLLLIQLFLLAGFSAMAQTHMPAYFFRHNVPVHHNGQQLAHAWAGGFNSPQFSTLDLNFDGTSDLFVFDRTHNKISTFLATSDSGTWRWQYAPEYESLFPDEMYYWALLVDYDFDGRKDLFCFVAGGTRVYRNISTPQTGLQWQLASFRLEYGPPSDPININTLATDISAYTDVDNDGDIDILMVEGAQVRYFRNLSKEQTGMPGLQPFVLETSFWGSVRECSCGTYVFGASATCRPAAEAPADTTGASEQEQRHSGNSLLAIDLDGDLDKDLLWGHVLCPHLAMLENRGTPAVALMQDYELNYPPNTLPASFESFPAAFYEDVNFDGKKDLLAAPNLFGQMGDTLFNFRESAWLYTNSGTTSVPQFTFSANNFLQGEMIERGNGAAPAFIDIDGDGDLDMIVGNDYGITTNGPRGTLALYTNTGTATDPVFELSNSDFQQLSSYRYFQVRPVVADINADGRPDLLFTSNTSNTLFGPTIGRVRYFLNTAPAGQPVTFGPMQVLQVGATDEPDDVPCFTDVDNDGKTDLLVGKVSGSLWYYRNTGTNAAPQYQLISSSFGQIVDDFFRTGLFPTITDADADGLPDLVTVDDNGTVRVYSDFRQQSGAFTASTHFVYNLATTTMESPFLGRRLAIAAADLDGDNRPELVIGNKGGGLVMLSRTSNINAVQPVQPAWQVQVYPNPASTLVRIESTVPVTAAVSDVLGRQVQFLQPQQEQQTMEIDVTAFAPGVYLLRLQTAQGQVQVKRLVVTN